jgi:hypothetical protein
MEQDPRNEAADGTVNLRPLTDFLDQDGSLQINLEFTQYGSGIVQSQTVLTFLDDDDDEMLEETPAGSEIDRNATVDE